jgi:FAD binding domain
VRSGGHCLEGWSNVDDGIVIGVSQMKSTKIGPSHTATVGAGLNQLEAVTELDKAGFAAPIGTEASVGLVAARLGDGTFAQGAIMVAPQPVTTRSFDVDDLQTEAVVERLLNRQRPCRRNSSRGVPLPRPPQHDTCHHRHRPARTSSAAGEMSVNQAQR